MARSASFRCTSLSYPFSSVFRYHSLHGSPAASASLTGWAGTAVLDMITAECYCCVHSRYQAAEGHCKAEVQSALRADRFPHLTQPQWDRGK